MIQFLNQASLHNYNLPFENEIKEVSLHIEKTDAQPVPVFLFNFKCIYVFSSNSPI